MQGLHKVISLWLYEWADDWKRMDVNLCSALFHWVDMNSHIIHSLDSYSNFSYPHGWKHCTKNKNIVVSSWTFSPESWGGYPGIMIAIRSRYQGYMGINLESKERCCSQQNTHSRYGLVWFSFPMLADERNGNKAYLPLKMERSLLSAQEKSSWDSSHLSDRVKVRKQNVNSGESLWVLWKVLWVSFVSPWQIPNEATQKRGFFVFTLSEETIFTAVKIHRLEYLD